MTLEQQLKALQDRLIEAEENARKAANAEHVASDVKRLLVSLDGRVKHLEDMHEDHGRRIEGVNGQQKTAGEQVSQMYRELVELKAKVESPSAQ